MTKKLTLFYVIFLEIVFWTSLMVIHFFHARIPDSVYEGVGIVYGASGLLLLISAPFIYFKSKLYGQIVWLSLFIALVVVLIFVRT